jgi:hypothetical protein
MITWLLRTWHRFTLARTAQRTIKIGYPGSVGNLAGLLETAARAALPMGVAFDVVYRRDSSLEAGTLRIVIEGR